MKNIKTNMFVKRTKSILGIFVLVLIFTKPSVAQQITFAKDKADLHEYLKITKIDAKKISYEIYMVNGECEEFKHKGKAILSSTGSESDIDDDNNGFDVTEYIDKSKTCYVSIRIGNQKGYTNRARFIIADCKSVCKTNSENLIKTK